MAGLLGNWLLARRSAESVWPPAVAQGHGAAMANVDLAGMDAARAAQIIAWAGEDGNTWVRLRVPWAEIEPEPGVRRWATLHAAVAAANQRDLHILLLLDGAPAWAVKAEDAANPLAPPRDVQDFGRFAAAVAGEFGEVVDHYQIWDEPNIAPHWGAGWVSPQGYFQLLREAANSIRSVDPAAQIVLAALAPTTADDTLNLADLAFLDALYRLGADAYGDVVAAAAYGFDRPPDDPPAADRLNFRRAELLYEVMAQHGDAATPVWITAWGWWSPFVDAVDSPWEEVDAATLAVYQQQGWAWAQRQWPWAGPMAWAEYALSPAADPRRAGFALRNAAGAQMLAGDQARRLEGVSTILGAGSHPASSPAVRILSGRWRFSPAGADPTDPGAELLYSFAGRAVAIEVQRGPYWATLTAWIDGQPAPALPRDAAGAAYLALHDPENGIEVVTLARDLPPGVHELRLQAAGGWGQWPLRRVLVDDRPHPQPWPALPLAAVLLAALALAGWAWGSAVRSPAARQTLRHWAQKMAATQRKVDGLMPGAHLPLALLVVLLFYLAPGLPLSLLLALPLAALLALRPDLAPALALAALPFYQRPKLLGPVGIPLHELLIWLGLGLWLAQAALPALALGRGRVRITTTDWLLLLFLFFGLCAAAAAERVGPASYDFRTVFLTPALFYLLVSRTGARLRDLSDGLVAGATALAAIGLWELAAGQVAMAEGVPRLAAVYGSANNVALYLARVIPLLVAVVGFPFLARSPSPSLPVSQSPGSPVSQSPGSPVSRSPGLPASQSPGLPVSRSPGLPVSRSPSLPVSRSPGLPVSRSPGLPVSRSPAENQVRWRLYALALPLVLAAAFLTFSKGLLLISLPAGLLLLAVFEPRLRRPVFGLLVVAALALLPFLRTPRFAGLIDTTSGTTFFRLQLWQSAWQMALDHPWLGVGPDNFLYAYRSRYVLPGAWQELGLSHPHNLLLDLLTRVGLLGALPALALLGQTLHRGFRRCAGQRPADPLFLGLLVGLAAGLLHGLIDNSIFLADLSVLTLLVVALVQRDPA